MIADIFFNLISAALVQQTPVVTEASYALSILALIYTVFTLIFMIGHRNNVVNKHVLYTILLVFIVLNITYSAFIIDYYTNHKSVDSTMSDLTLAIVVIFSIAVIFYVAMDVLYMGGITRSLIELSRMKTNFSPFSKSLKLGR